MRQLVTRVHVNDDEGRDHVFFPGEKVPEWAAKQMGDHCWVDDGDSTSEVEVPPKSGKGSGLAAWAKYADAHGVAVEDDDTRDDIIAQLVAGGIPVGDE